jgi:hypothetical protein
MPPDEPTDEERQEELDQDSTTPFQPADDTSSAPVDDTHPATDTDVDSDELYQEGTTAATNAPEPDDPGARLEDVGEISADEEE